MSRCFQTICPFIFAALSAVGAHAATPAAATPPAAVVEDLEDAAERAKERLGDYLNMDHQRGLRARQYDIAPDARKAEQLQLDRRLEQQRYERLQAQRDLEMRRDGSTLPTELLEQRAVLQQQVRSQERQLQYQRFETDRERQLQLLDRGRFLAPLTGSPPPRIQ